LYQFRAGVQTYTADSDAEETDMSIQKCQVAAWWLLLPQQYRQWDPLQNQMATCKSRL